MNQYKVICKIDKNENKGMEAYTLFIKEASDEEKAFSLAKGYMLTEFPNWGFYGTYSIKKI